MYKTLCIAVLMVGLLALMGHSSSAAPAPFTSPQIVARGKLVNQKAAISPTTILTTVQTGVYRLSIYATLSEADANSTSQWSVFSQWTDDAGAEEAGISNQYGNLAGQFNCYSFFNAAGGPTVTFEARGGTPISYSVFQSGPPDNSAYSLYYTLERLE
jgi:hypothetical protein